jgi:hypothetical protein
MTQEEMELIQMIRNSKDPARALEIAVEIILANIPGIKLTAPALQRPSE